MVDEDFYIEKSSPLKIFFTFLLSLLVLGVFVGVYFFYFYHEPIKLKTITIELGAKVPSDPNYYVKGSKKHKYIIDLSSVSVDEEGITNSVGEYSYKVTLGKESKKGKIYVKDTTPPIVELKELTVGLNEDFEVEDFVLSCEDLSEICFVYYKKESEENLSENVGEYNVTLSIKDKYDNTITKTTKLIVSKDASLNAVKSNDLTPASLYPKDEKWNNTYTVKFSKGLLETDESFEAQILTLTNTDFMSLFEEKVIHQTLLNVYNQYNYVIGFSMKLEFENGNIVYVTENDLKNSSEE